MIRPNEKTTLDRLIEAAGCGELALVETTEAGGGARVVAIAHITWNGHHYTVQPLARLFTGDPIEELTPPAEAWIEERGTLTRGGGYHPGGGGGGGGGA
jgi:hypothetical protein